MRIIFIVLLTLWIAFGLVVLNNMDIRLYAQSRIINNVDHLPDFGYVLVLGAGRNYAFSRPNYAFIGRMDAVAAIWKKHPQLQLILSGKSDGDLYNEPQDMLRSLNLRGVPTKNCLLDSHSYTTFESVKRFQKTFGFSPIIVSQKAHLERAIWMAKTCGMNAIGFQAYGYPGGTPRWIIFREYLARIKARLVVWGLIKSKDFNKK